jgi:hypothetical protein
VQPVQACNAIALNYTRLHSFPFYSFKAGAGTILLLPSLPPEYKVMTLPVDSPAQFHYYLCHLQKFLCYS